MVYKKGQSGNPNGRPRVGLTLAEAIRDKVPPELLINELWKRAKAGSVQAIEILLDRGWGKAPLQLLLTATTQKYDLDALTAEELTVFEQLVEKMENDKRLAEPSDNPSRTG